jgi:hypothetical protein
LIDRIDLLPESRDTGAGESLDERL